MKKVTKSLLAIQYIVALFFVIILVYYFSQYIQQLAISGVMIGVVIMYSMFKHTIYRDSLLKSIINLMWVIILTASFYLFITQNFVSLLIFWVLIIILSIIFFTNIKIGKSRILVEIFLEFSFYLLSLITFLALGFVYVLFDNYILNDVPQNYIFIKRIIQLFFIYCGLMIPYQVKMLMSNAISIDESIYTLEEQTNLINNLVNKYGIKEEFKTIMLADEDYQMIEMFINQKVFQSLTGVSHFEHYAKNGIKLRITYKGSGIKNNIPEEKINITKEQNIKSFLKTCNQMKLFACIVIVFSGFTTIFCITIVLQTLSQIIDIVKSNLLSLTIIGTLMTCGLWMGHTIWTMNENFHKLWKENQEKILEENKQKEE